ncbi:MAG: hypothetical protein LBU60_00445 [Clostridiales bacterium]|jgi:hypothetical protein|nr:hypothetical protein [Clostridiales bacterium]
MNAKKITMIIASALLVLVLIGICVLTFIRQSFLYELPGEFISVEIFADGENKERAMPNLYRDYTNDEFSKQNFGLFEDAMRDTRFRLIIGAVQGKFMTSPKFVKDSDGEREKLGFVEWSDLKSPSNHFMVNLSWGFGNFQNIKIEGEQLTFDRLTFMVSDTNDQVVAVRAYAYSFEYFMSGTDPNDSSIIYEEEDRYVYPFDFFANTTGLYRTIQDLVSQQI